MVKERNGKMAKKHGSTSSMLLGIFVWGVSLIGVFFALYGALACFVMCGRIG